MAEFEEALAVQAEKLSWLGKIHMVVLGIPVDQSSKALETYEGIYRRTQLVGVMNGIAVIDDFAHNPSEVAAAISSCQQISKRVFAWFQPHGFGPLRFMHEELALKVSETLRQEDIFMMSDVYYAGGTVNKDIGSETVTDAVKKTHPHTLLVNDRSALPEKLKSMVQTGDVILLMGARDPSLSEFASEVLKSL